MACIKVAGDYNISSFENKVIEISFLSAFVLHVAEKTISISARGAWFLTTNPPPPQSKEASMFLVSLGISLHYAFRPRLMLTLRYCCLVSFTWGSPRHPGWDLVLCTHHSPDDFSSVRSSCSWYWCWIDSSRFDTVSISEQWPARHLHLVLPIARMVALKLIRSWPGESDRLPTYLDNKVPTTLCKGGDFGGGCNLQQGNLNVTIAGPVLHS